MYKHITYTCANTPLARSGSAHAEQSPLFGATQFLRLLLRGQKVSFISKMRLRCDVFLRHIYMYASREHRGWKRDEKVGVCSQVEAFNHSWATQRASGTTFTLSSTARARMKCLWAGILLLFAALFEELAKLASGSLSQTFKNNNSSTSFVVEVQKFWHIHCDLIMHEYECNTRK